MWGAGSFKTIATAADYTRGCTDSRLCCAALRCSTVLRPSLWRSGGEGPRHHLRAGIECAREQPLLCLPDVSATGARDCFDERETEEPAVALHINGPVCVSLCVGLCVCLRIRNHVLKALAAQSAENELVRFLVGTQGPCHDNQVSRTVYTLVSGRQYFTTTAAVAAVATATATTTTTARTTTTQHPPRHHHPKT